MCFLRLWEPLIWAWFGIRPRCRHVRHLLGSSRSSLQSREWEEASHSLLSGFRDRWVWWQLRLTWYLLACCTWDPYRGGSRPRLRMIKVTRRCLCALDMWRQPWFLSQGPVLGAPWRVPHRLGSRHPVEAGAEARGMDASPQGGEADLESVWPGTGGPLRYSGDSAMSPLVLSNSSSSTGAGCHGTDVAKASSVCFSPDRSAPGSSGESVPGRGQSTSGSTVLAGPSMVLGPDFSPRQLSMGDSRQETFPLTSGGLSPPPGDVEVLGVAPEGAQLIASGLSTEVVETILQSRAPSARKMYALKWKLSLHGVETASSTQSTARLVQFWSSCRPDSLQGWPTPPWRFTLRQFGLPHLSWWALSG